jgi:phospholipid transport system substrate-binding protein
MPTHFSKLQLIVVLVAVATPPLLISCACAGTVGRVARTSASAIPSTVVASFDHSLLMTMKAGGKAGMGTRYAIMLKAVKRTFDLPFIGKLVLGHYWGTFSPAQRSDFMRLFARLVAVTYAYNFNGYNGQVIKVERSVTRAGNAFVYTAFFKPGSGHRHSFDYVLRKDGNRWLIVNIVADGVSDMAIKREEYQNFLRHRSFSDLMAVMQHHFIKLYKMGER